MTCFKFKRDEFRTTYCSWRVLSLSGWGHQQTRIKSILKVDPSFHDQKSNADHISLVSNSNATNIKLRVPLNKSFELEMRDGRNMTKFNSLVPQWNILPTFGTKMKHLINIYEQFKYFETQWTKMNIKWYIQK